MQTWCWQLDFSQLGPFIDSEHPDIKKGTTDRSFDEIFHFEILRKVITFSNRIFLDFSFVLFWHTRWIGYSQLQDYVECMGSAARVLLVPSIRDANHDFVFPQVMIKLSQPWSYDFCSRYIASVLGYLNHPKIDLNHLFLQPALDISLPDLKSQV